MTLNLDKNNPYVVRPKQALIIRILKEVLGEKELENLIDEYMKKKKELAIKRLEVKNETNHD